MRNTLGLILLIAAVPFAASANDYPTLERVDHVLTCMKTHGGQTVDNLYACSCEIDIIAQQMDFEDFSEARTFEIYRRMPGEKGGIFRDSERAEVVVGELDKARADANKRCFIGMNRKKANAVVKTAGEPE
ncbi:MAG: hypothetical protein O7G83_08275 [Proteobacteria bacterium]|nr:hypothetical protein [Pseudomonadota bacterium]